MPAVRRVLKHLIVESAQRKRKCHRNKEHAIVAGEPCLVIDNADLGTKNYCAQCATEILDQARTDLNALTKTLGA